MITSPINPTAASASQKHTPSPHPNDRALPISTSQTVSETLKTAPTPLSTLQKTGVIGGVTFGVSMAVPLDAIRMQFFAKVDPAKMAQSYGAGALVRGMLALSVTNSVRRAGKVGGLEGLNNGLPQQIAPLKKDILSGGIVASIEAPLMNAASVVAQVKATFLGTTPPTYRDIGHQLFNKGFAHGLHTLGRGGLATGVQFAIIDIGLNVGNRIFAPYIKAALPDASKSTQTFATIFSSSVFVCLFGGGQAEQAATLMRQAKAEGHAPTYGQLCKEVVAEGYAKSGIKGAAWAAAKGGLLRGLTVAPQFSLCWGAAKMAVEYLESH